MNDMIWLLAFPKHAPFDDPWSDPRADFFYLFLLFCFFAALVLLANLQDKLRDLKEARAKAESGNAELNCIGKHLTNLDLTKVPRLAWVYCGDNQLTELDLSAVPLLTELHCGHNQLTKLDLSAVPLLKVLCCHKNQLTELDLSAVPLLTTLHCGHNQLTKLDLSAVPSLSFLYCERNQLTELDIRPLVNLQRLDYDSKTTRLIQRPDQHF